MRFFRTLIVAGVVCVLVAPLTAQQGTSDMRGRVLDPQSGTLPGVTLMIKNQQTGMYRQTVSDHDGIYVFSGVTPGMWELTAELAGFQSVRRRDIRLEIGNTSTIDLKMTLTGVAEQITVTADAPIVDVTSKEVGGNITSRELVELPTINRNFIGFVGLLPGVVPNISTESFGSDSVSVNGQDSRNNNFLVDGGNNNDDVIGQRAGTQARTPIEAIQEFQVLTGQYDAEFGRTTGAIINALTKQGTNDFSGTAFGFLQDASFTEKDFFAKQLNRPKPDTKFLQYGATLGGPIARDRLHFFLSVERPEVDRGTTINIPARPEFNTTTTTQDRVWNTMVRVDGQLNARNNGAFRWLREESPQLNQIIPLATLNGTLPVTLAAAREEIDVDQTTVLHWNTVLDNSKFNTARLVWTQENVSFGNPGFNGNGRQQAGLLPTLVYLTFVDQQNSVAQARVNNAYYLEDTFNWYVSRHDLRMGAQAARLTNHQNAQDNMNGTFTFRTNGPFNASDFRTYPERLQIRVPGESDRNMAVKYYGIFLQDKWAFRDNMTLSLGARYDLEELPIDETDNPLFSDPDDYPVDSNNISPRLGLTYNLGAARPTILRGGVGRFYDKTHLELITGAMTSGVFSDSFIATFPSNSADPGPSQGNRPSDPFLANGPTVDRALLAQRFPPGTKIKNTGAVVLDSPDRVIPYVDQVSIGIEHQLSSKMSASFDYVHGEGRDQFMSYERNPGERVDTSRTGRINRIDAANFTASVLERVNTGRTKFDSYQFQIDHHLGSSYQYRVAYTFSESRGNTSGAGTPISAVQFLKDMNLDLNKGPTDFDRPHNLVLSASWTVPHTGGLTLATIARYVSGSPFTIQDSNSDPDRNGILFDPLPAGTYSGSGANSMTVSNEGGRNGARGPDFMQIDGRLGYKIPIAGVTTHLIAELFNITDRVNYATPSGDRRSPLFLVRTTTSAGSVPRTGQLGIRMTF